MIAAPAKRSTFAETKQQLCQQSREATERREAEYRRELALNADEEPVTCWWIFGHEWGRWSRWLLSRQHRFCLKCNREQQR